MPDDLVITACTRFTSQNDYKRLISTHGLWASHTGSHGFFKAGHWIVSPCIHRGHFIWCVACLNFPPLSWHDSCANKGIVSIILMISSRIIWHEHRNPNTPCARRAANVKLFMVSMTMFIVATVVCRFTSFRRDNLSPTVLNSSIYRPHCLVALL